HLDPASTLLLRLHVLPIDWRVAEQHADLPRSRQGCIHAANDPIELLPRPVETEPWLRSVAPDVAQRLDRHVLAADVAVGDILIARAPLFDDDVVDGRNEAGIVDHHLHQRVPARLAVTGGDGDDAVRA